MTTWSGDSISNGDSENKEVDSDTNNISQSDETENEWKEDARHICEFPTDMVFNTRQNMIDWVKKEGIILGYVIVIKRSVTASSGKNPRVLFQCERGGVYRRKKISTKKTGTKKRDCPFRLEGKYFQMENCWKLKLLCEAHNHKPAVYMEGHSYPGRLSEKESQLVKDLSNKNVKPRDILTALKNQNMDSVTTIKTIYNERHKSRMVEKGGRTQMQVVMSFLKQEKYFYESRKNSSTNELEGLFFANRKSLKMWRAFPHVLLIDATYKTNRYKVPLLEIVGVTSTNMTFCVAFVFMHKEDESNYTWALNCLKSTMEGCTTPRVIVTDRELALMNAYSNVFPEAKGLLCRWHIYTNIVKKCRPSLKSRKCWKVFFKSWKKLVKSESDEAYVSNLAQLEGILLNFPGVLTYLNNNWLEPYKEMFVSVWTDKFLNFGNHTTNRVESQHAKLKKYLESSNSDLQRSLSFIHQVIQSQVTSIRGSLERSNFVMQHRFNVQHFEELCGFVSIHALDIIFEEFEECKTRISYENCGCQLRTSHGLPCAHEQAIYLNKGHSIPLHVIDPFWRKLDLLPCKSIEDDDLDCEHELQMIKKQFNKQTMSGKISILRKLREIIDPSTTLVSEPAFKVTTRGRPSFKNKKFKKTHVDMHVPTPEQSTDSCSSIVRSVELNDSQFPKKKSYNMHKNYSHPYIRQFPSVLHSYIRDVQDVRSDGNCGFRVIALWLGLNEDAWPTVRKDLIEELNMYRDEYIDMFGFLEWSEVYNSLNFFQVNKFAARDYWMSMPNMGVLIASKYNVILHVLSNNVSMTYLPLRSSPPPWYQHTTYTMGHVNDDHYVKVTLKGGTMPTIMPQWIHFRYDCAAAWTTPYMSRFKEYTEYMCSRSSKDYVTLDD